MAAQRTSVTDELRAINQEAVTFGLVSQEDADLCTKHGRSLEGKVTAHRRRLDIGEDAYRTERDTIRRAMWGD